jgi:hypothetical protein
MDSVLSWIILDFVALVAGIRFAVYVLDQYEKHQKEMRNNDKW